VRPEVFVRGRPAPSSAIDYAQVPLEKVAFTADTLPAGAALRSDGFKGKIIRVEGRIAPGRGYSLLRRTRRVSRPLTIRDSRSELGAVISGGG
jgi:hypothetical protein